MNDFATYDNPLIARYASRAMAELWGPLRKFRTWRQLWLALAEAQYELGLTADDGVTPRIRPAQLDEMRAHLDDIDFARAKHHERRLRHDVMAHILTFAECCPTARDIIHLGATSCYVTDNTDLLLMHEGLGLVRAGLVAVIDALGQFAQRWRDLPTLGYTHFQPAQITTVGKRACLWAYDFVLDLHEVEHRLTQLRLRGAKGSTGTQASFLALFRGDPAKVVALEHRVAQKLGLSAVYPVTGQTYPRKVDTQVLDALSGLGQSAHKWGCDLRLLAHEQEIEEPFEEEQVGSSAMAYKRNPMRAERLCSLSRWLMGMPVMAAQTAAGQWLERTLDDSAVRRLYLPQAFLAADAVLRLALNVARGLEVNPAVVGRRVERALPFLATEDLLMAGVAKGGDRQLLHERIRQHSLAVSARLKAGAVENDLFDRIRADPLFAGVDGAKVVRPQQYVGRAPEQVTEFLTQYVEPIRRQYPQFLQQSGDVSF